MPDGSPTRRHLDLEGAYNIRDIGGYRTKDGRLTRWNTLLRAGSLHRLPPSSQAALIGYGVRTVIDLRTAEEAQQAPTVFAASSDVGYHHQDMIGDTPLEEVAGFPSDALSFNRIVEIYTKTLDRRQPQFCKTLATLAEPGVLPAMVHCAGGKDRTGLIIALLLGVVGVPEETIAEDYALSARFLLDRYFTEEAPPGVSASNYTWEDYQRENCPPESMLDTLSYLGERYGGVEGYVRAIGLTQDQIDSLRAALVE